MSGVLHQPVGCAIPTKAKALQENTAGCERRVKQDHLAGVSRMLEQWLMATRIGR
jgi:hypothetical protein